MTEIQKSRVWINRVKTLKRVLRKNGPQPITKLLSLAKEQLGWTQMFTRNVIAYADEEKIFFREGKWRNSLKKTKTKSENQK